MPITVADVDIIVHPDHVWISTIDVVANVVAHADIAIVVVIVVVPPDHSVIRVSTMKKSPINQPIRTVNVPIVVPHADVVEIVPSNHAGQAIDVAVVVPVVVPIADIDIVVPTNHGSG